MPEYPWVERSVIQFVEVALPGAPASLANPKRDRIEVGLSKCDLRGSETHPYPSLLLA